MLPFRTDFLTLESRRRCQKAAESAATAWRLGARWRKRRGIRDYPRDEIIQHHAELQQLLLDMAARQAGGRCASGRYKAYDTARLLYIKTVAPRPFLSLRLGSANASILKTGGCCSSRSLVASYNWMTHDPRIIAYYQERLKSVCGSQAAC